MTVSTLDQPRTKPKRDRGDRREYNRTRERAIRAGT